jgi:hypothetical protein
MLSHGIRRTQADAGNSARPAHPGHLRISQYRWTKRTHGHSNPTKRSQLPVGTPAALSTKQTQSTRGTHIYRSRRALPNEPTTSRDSTKQTQSTRDTHLYCNADAPYQTNPPRPQPDKTNPIQSRHPHLPQPASPTQRTHHVPRLDKTNPIHPRQPHLPRAGDPCQTNPPRTTQAKQERMRTSPFSAFLDF